MSQVPRKNNPGLFVVKGDTPVSSKVTVMTRDRLDARQSGLLSIYLRTCSTEGNCIGALVGSADWDIRPMVLENGVLTLTRFSDPSDHFQKNGYNSLHALSMRLVSGSETADILAQGSGDGQLWIKRRFYQSTLAESRKTFQSISRQEQLKKLLSLTGRIKKLHAAGIFHGHICLSNISWEDAEPALLDYGFLSTASFRQAVHGIAPELKENSTAGCPTDIYGLGLVIESIFDSVNLPDEIRVIESMLSENPALRPGIDEIDEFFAQRVIEPEARQIAQTVAVIEEEEPEAQSAVPAETLPQEEDKTAAAPVAETKAAADLLTPSKPETTDAPAAENREQERPADEGIKPLLSAAHQASARPGADSSSLGLGILAVLISCAIYMVFFYSRPDEAESATDLAPQVAGSYEDLWKTGQPSLMRQVAFAAVRNRDKMAQAAIVADALSSGKPLKVRADLIKTAFDPRWEDRLSDRDREIALRLALTALIPEEPASIPELKDAHPGLLLAIMGSLNPETHISQLAGTGIQGLSGLPVPLGPSFAELARLNIENLNDKSVRAFAHISLGGSSQDLVSAFFGTGEDDLTVFRKLRVLVPYLKSSPALETALYMHLVTNSKLFASTYRWFEDEEFAGWDKVSRGEKIAIVAGFSPQNELSFEQYSDLLRFPNPRIRTHAREHLGKKFYNGSFGEILDFLAGGENKLTRYQTITALAAFPLKGQDATTFFRKWFAEKPDAQTVLGLLIARNTAAKDDVFNFEAAQYLSQQEWKASLDMLKKLSIHPEALARALAYSSMDITKPEERRLLETMAVREANPTLRRAIQTRLQPQ